VPQLSTENGRIYFYRPSVHGAAIQPNIYLNGKVVGKAVSKGFFYVDTPLGEYKAVATTEVRRTLSFTLDKGETKYVLMQITMGFWVGHISCELVDETTALKEMKDCKNINPAQQ
jgi:hypothetical protein